MTSRRFLARCGGLLLAGLLVLGSAHAAWPEKQITLIVPFSPGGSTDVVARLIAQGMSTRLKQPVVVDNKPGAASQIGLDLFARSPADGYTLFMMTPATATLPVMTKGLRTEPAKVTAPISLVATGEVALIGTGQLPIRNWKEFVAYGKANPGKLSFGYAGGYLQLMGDYMLRRDKVDAVNVLYRGSTDVQQGLLAGTVSAGVLSIVGMEGFIKEDKLRVLAVTGRKRMALYPDVPTVSESGFPELELEDITYFGIGAPAGTPKAVIDQLNAVIAEVVRTPEYQKRVADFRMEAASSTPERLGELIVRSERKWNDIAQKVGFKPE